LAAAKKKNDKAGNSKLLGFSKSGWVSTGKIASKSEKPSKNTGFLFFAGNSAAEEACKKILKSKCSPWQLDLLNAKKKVIHLQSEFGPVWVIKGDLGIPHGTHHGLLDESLYSAARDVVGRFLGKIYEYNLEKLQVEFVKAKPGQITGAMVGLELASYSYRQTQGINVKNQPKLLFVGAEKSNLTAASAIGVGVNLARHLVNTPAGTLQPKSYGEFTKALFAGVGSINVSIWNEARLIKEKLNLLHSVGRAAENQAQLIHISYKPTGKKRMANPIAFVGKGVTFDTGGLDLKPAGPMRLMKKDMGGSASLVGLAWWLHAGKCDVACDIYLAVAENGVDDRAMRPGDVLHSRIGKSIEIHNTDAEGRLVLADALVVAAAKKGKDKPAAIIDLATLTGAMRVALGTRVAGLCSNSDPLADAIVSAGQKTGDPCWRMPLVPGYKDMLSSTVADVSNCSAGGFGGGITAALFLEMFIGDNKWAHIDMMAWADKPHGALTEVGGNGQMVQALSHFLQNLKPSSL